MNRTPTLFLIRCYERAHINSVIRCEGDTYMVVDYWSPYNDDTYVAACEPSPLQTDGQWDRYQDCDCEMIGPAPPDMVAKHDSAYESIQDTDIKRWWIRMHTANYRGQ